MSDELKYVAGIDTSGYDEALEHMVDSAESMSSQITDATAKIQDQLSNIPQVDIDFLQAIRSAEEMENGIGEAFAQIASVIRINGEEIANLEAMYAEASREANKFANVPSMQGHYNELQQQKKAIKAVIAERKKAIASAKEAEKSLEKEKQTLLKSAQAMQKNNTQSQTLRQRMKELEAEAANLVATAQEEGRTLDQSTGRYREIIEELGRLKDIRGDIAAAGNVFANDENQMAGVVQGLSGLMGAYTAAQGVIGLFGSENEKLNEVMLKVQSLMAITMGLQQVQTMLNKDSTFSLVTLNTIKSIFKKNTEEEVDALAEENTELASNTAQTNANTVSKEAGEAIEIADTEATELNTAATKANSGAMGASSAATQQASAKTAAHTTTMTAATVATKAGTTALKLFKLALISTGIGALIWGVGELVGWIVSLFDATEEETEAQKAANEAQEEGAKAYAKAHAQISLYKSRLDNFNGTQEDEKKLLKEVNQEFGEQFGHAKSLQEAKDLLAQKGEDYCRALEKEAIAQAYLNKYVEAYCHILEVEQEIKDGKYHSIFQTSAQDRAADQRARQNAQNDANSYLNEYKRLMQEAAEIRQSASIGGHSSTTTHSGRDSGGHTDNFDPQRAAQQRKQAIEQWQNAVEQYTRNANAQVAQANIEAMEEGLAKELAALDKQTEEKKRAWNQQLLDLGKAQKQARKAVFLSQKGHTEAMWDASADGQKTDADWARQLLENPQNAEMAHQYYAQLDRYAEESERARLAIRQKYQDKWIKEYGTDLQKAELFEREWSERLKLVLQEMPEMYDQVYKQYEQEKTALNLDKFKLSINWEDVFGNLDEQSLSSLQFTLDKVKTYFNSAKSSMSVTEIKDFQEAIAKMEEEIASRNPFTAMHHSLRSIGEAKTEFVNAMTEMQSAQEELTSAREEYNALMQEKNQAIDATEGLDNDKQQALYSAQETLIAKENEYQTALAHRQEIQAKIDSGELAADCQELTDATNALTTAEQARADAQQARDEAIQAIDNNEQAQAVLNLVDVNQRLEASQTRLTTAQTKQTNAEQNVLTARNKITKSYKQFAKDLQNAGGVATDVGKKASKLAAVFSKDIADGMDKALDCIDEVLDATTSVVSAIGDVGKSVAKGVASTVDATSQGAEAASATAATSISTVEKASVILTIISAALQVATAIANLFNNDDKKQKQIEALQERIDQLQWELDNQDAVRLQKNVGNALEQLRSIYAQAREEVLKLHGVTAQSSLWAQWITAARNQTEIYSKTVEKLADYWGQVSYTADKALGEERYKSSRAQLENLAQQQLLIQQQIDKEASKKDSDSGKIQDYQNKIAELAEEMATLINDMLEDIIGSSAEDIAKTLGDGFIEAIKAGEDAMEAWHAKTKEIVADILQRMMVQKYLEPEIGKIFDKYKNRWFGNDGSFKGIDAVTNSMTEFSNDIDAVGAQFAAIWESLSSSMGDWFSGDEERDGASRGIATASQDSVDENNARLTVIQSHTYTLVQGVAELNTTGNQMLQRLTNIDGHTERTAETLEEVQTDIKRMKNAVEDITTKGIKLK